jgi:rubrerythrin
MKQYKYTKEKIIEVVNQLGYNLISIESIGNEGKITISNSDGYHINTRINNILRSTKPIYFSQNNSHTIDNIKLWCKLNNKSYQLVSNIYKNSIGNLKWQCLLCNYTFDRSWNTTNKNLFDCPHCSGRKVNEANNSLIINPDIAKQWNYDRNYPIRPENIQSNTTKKFWWLCNTCGHEWEKSVHYRNQRNAPCPNCKMSKGEYAIKCYLENNNINYIYEHSFNDCKNIKNLRFDFYLPDINMCIEYQGEYHYKVLKGISNENILKTQKKCDNIKNKYCKLHEITLLKIPYWENKNIVSILCNRIN